MKVLMFGWEFPPHISGGLGTASYGLTKGLSRIKDVDVTFVVPKAYGDEDQRSVKLLGAGDIPITKRKLHLKNFSKAIDYLEVKSGIVPYVDPEDFWRLSKKEVSGRYNFIQVDSEGKIIFSGKYGTDLLTEIRNYSIVASVIAEESEFDLIHAHDWLAYPAGIAAKEVSGKPLVIHVHATDFDRSGGKVNPDVYAIEKKGMDIADLIITVSNLTRDTVINKYHINPAKVFTVYNAVEPVDKIEKAKYKKGTDEKIVTFLGRITFQKGPEYFILAASKILQKMDNVRFVMAGSGDMMNKMIIMTARLGITNKFNFTGFLKGDDVYEMLRLSDVYIMPSISEPFGISPLEALQSNVPVIISNQSGVAEILTHAIKTDFWDIDAIADSIFGILKYPALTKMFTKYGKKEVDDLSWENSALKVKEIYNKALSLN